MKIRVWQVVASRAAHRHPIRSDCRSIGSVGWSCNTKKENLQLQLGMPEARLCVDSTACGCLLSRIWLIFVGDGGVLGQRRGTTRSPLFFFSYEEVVNGDAETWPHPSGLHPCRMKTMEDMTVDS